MKSVAREKLFACVKFSKDQFVISRFSVQSRTQLFSIYAAAAAKIGAINFYRSNLHAVLSALIDKIVRAFSD